MRHLVQNKPNGGGKTFSPGISQPSENSKPKKAQKAASLVKLAKEKFNCSDPNYFRFVIDEYLRGKCKMSVFNMRENIRIFTSVLFFNGKYHPNKKCRGLWQEQKPFKWLVDTPFCDPNNAVQQQNGGKKKPSKGQLAQMIDFLIKYYQACERDGTLKFPPKEPPPNSQPRSHRVRFMLQEKQKQEILRQPVQNSEAHEELGPCMTSVPSIQEQINPGMTIVKTTTDPTEVSGSDAMMKAKELTDIGAIKRKLQEAENFVFELNGNSSGLMIPITTAYQTTQMQPQSSCDPEFNLEFKKSKDPLPKASPVPSPTNPYDLMSNIELRSPSDNWIEEILSGNPMMAINEDVKKEKQVGTDADLLETELATKSLMKYYGDDFLLENFNELFTTESGKFDLDSINITFPDEQSKSTPDINFNVQTQQKDDKVAKREVPQQQIFPHKPVFEAMPPNVEVQGLPKSNNGELAMSVQESPITYAGESMMVAHEEIVEQACDDGKYDQEENMEGVSSAAKFNNVQPVDDICHPIAENMSQDVTVSHEVVIDMPEIPKVSNPVASSDDCMLALPMHQQQPQNTDLLTQICQQSGFENNGMELFSPSLFSMPEKTAPPMLMQNNRAFVTLQKPVAAPSMHIQQDLNYLPPLNPGKRKMVVNGKMILTVPNDVYAPVVHARDTPVPLLPKPAPRQTLYRNEVKQCVEAMDVEDDPRIPTVVADFN